MAIQSLRVMCSAYMENQIYKHAMHGNTKFTGECAVYTWRTRYINMPCMAIQSLRVNVQCIHGEPDI